MWQFIDKVSQKWRVSQTNPSLRLRYHYVSDPPCRADRRMGSLQEYGVERRACHAKMVIWYGALGRSEISSELKGTIAEERSVTDA
jgi:hypothetical protein